MLSPLSSNYASRKYTIALQITPPESCVFSVRVEDAIIKVHSLNMKFCDETETHIINEIADYDVVDMYGFPRFVESTNFIELQHIWANLLLHRNRAPICEYFEYKGFTITATGYPGNLVDSEECDINS